VFFSSGKIHQDFLMLINQFIVILMISSRFIHISCGMVPKIPAVQVPWVLHFWRELCRCWFTTHCLIPLLMVIDSRFVYFLFLRALCSTACRGHLWRQQESFRERSHKLKGLYCEFSTIHSISTNHCMSSEMRNF